jgi:hypothetical protein
MKTTIATILACLLLCFGVRHDSLAAQVASQVPAQAAALDSTRLQTVSSADDYINLPVNFGLFPGVSLGGIVRGISGKKISNILALNFVGNADRLTGIDLPTLWSSYNDDSYGVQLSGIGNLASKSMSGIQSAGVLNITDGGFHGGQGAGVFNIVGKDLYGAQGGGVANIVTGSTEGIQSAGVLNLTSGAMNGLQAAGVMNIANSARRHGSIATTGVQAAGVCNFAGEMNGVQLAGVFNAASAMNGVHLSLLNFADSGTGVPIGLLSVVGNVGVEVQLWGDEMGFAHATLRTGTRSFANYLGIGRNVAAPAGLNIWALTYGVGAEFELSRNLFATVDGYRPQSHCW